ncbi:uncharacterized protein A4U43_C05F32230 [Asparagus officinalis]|uniref:Uncharacterized protein n=1 Tax=Asparagus officinalis TaxID=4686 RepID=A0A5P1EWK7_ASPOF|nr:uncharacterized protein A4U43_C05F32230 [Asparagus officinalis]
MDRRKCQALAILLFILSVEARPLLINRELEGKANKNFTGVAENQGPSTGIGHEYGFASNIGGMKDSGPSPGQGHGATVKVLSRSSRPCWDDPMVEGSRRLAHFTLLVGEMFRSFIDKD